RRARLFPPRRSSDLLALALAAAIVAGIQVARAGVVPQGLRGTPLIALAVVATPPVLLQLVAVATGGAPSGPLIALSALSSITSLDRKSTRLNSSHVK